MIESGAPLFVVEYRSTNVGTVNYRDGKTGLDASFVKVVHNIEMGNIQCGVAERVDDKFDEKTYRCPFKKGDRVVFHVTGFTQEKGIFKGSGKLEAITP